jgi:plastocyanin
VGRWRALLVAACCVAPWQGGDAQGRGGRVAGRLTMLEKKGKPSPDLGAAVVYLERHAAPASPLATEIAISDKEFVPRVVAVPVGSAVRFTNHDPFEHNVFSVSEPASFDLGQYGRGEGKQWTFTKPGLVRVFCNVHPRMVAFVHVLATRYYTQPAADGTFAIEDVAPGQYALHAWHERSPEVVRELSVAAAGVAGLEIQLDARGFHRPEHKNKFGEDYVTDAGRDRY